MKTSRFSNNRRLSKTNTTSINSHDNASGYAQSEGSPFDSGVVTFPKTWEVSSRALEKMKNNRIIIGPPLVSCHAKAQFIKNRGHKYVKLNAICFNNLTGLEANIQREALSFVGPGIRKAEQGRLMSVLVESKGHPVDVEVDARLEFAFDSKRIVGKPTYFRNWKLAKVVEEMCK